MANSRDDGFSIADVSTVLLDDVKVRKLARRCPDDGELSTRIVIYMATLLVSWREGRRVTASDAESWVELSDDRLTDLREVGLFDAENRITAHAWVHYFKPAWERREQARANGRKGAARRWGWDGDPIATPSQPDSNGVAGASQPDSGSMPDRPTVPSFLPTGSPSSRPPASPSGDKKNGSKNQETEEERYARYLRLRDDPSQSADIRHAASKAVEQYEATHRAN